MTTHLRGPGPVIVHHGRVTSTQRIPAPVARSMTAILTLAAVFISMMVMAGPASAHARLEKTSPTDCASLTATPPEVMLRFNEPVKEGLNQVSVTSGSTDATDGKLEIDGNTVYQKLKSSLPSGTYKVTYKVVSGDGHPISGSISFTYAPPKGDDGANPPATSTPSSSSSSSSAPTPTATSPSTSAPAPAPSSSSAEPTATSTSTSTSPSASSSPSTASSTSSSSSSTPVGDGETDATPLPSQSSTDGVATADSDDSDGVPLWVWVAVAGAVLVLLAGVALALRGRRRDDDEDDIELEEWRG